jgi:hypothetical protein
MKFYRMITPLLVLSASCVLASEAYAQPSDTGGVGGIGDLGRSGGRNSTSSAQSGDTDSRTTRPGIVADPNSLAQVNFRLSQLRGALKLAPEQTELWQAFAARVGVLAEDIARERGLTMDLTPGADPSAAKGLAHIGLSLEAARTRVVLLEEVDASAKALYKSLTPEQKALADARLPRIVAPRALAPVGNE